MAVTPEADGLCSMAADAPTDADRPHPPVSSGWMRVLDAAFGHPRGLAGRLGGAVMARGNQEQERRAVDRADLRAGQRTVVVGCGPGVGAALAADRVGSDGYLLALDPSQPMRDMARRRCSDAIAEGVVEVREGTAEHIGCPDRTVDAAISVNNVMLWDRPAGFAELFRVLRPGGLLVLTVHRHVLGCPAEQLGTDATAAGFDDLELVERPRRWISPAVELTARRP